MNGESTEENILALYEEEKWPEILTLNSKIEETAKCRLFWVLPTVSDLCWINELIKKHDMLGIVSVGCGCGLFEWLYQKYSGLDVTGIELDRSWWCSKYSPPTFLRNVLFLSESKTRDFCASAKHALLFCYFNNGDAFRSYAKNYGGNLILVIGPIEGQARWTDPLPFDEKFEALGWTLIGVKRLERSQDYVTAYSR